MDYKGLDVAIEVTVKEGDSSKQRGDLLEALAKRILLTLQHEHVKTEVRVTGCELDLVATEKQTANRVSVECKAYRDRSVSADVITKMLGNLFAHDFNSTWLITTSRLGKDAVGLMDSIRASPEKAKKIRVYDPEELVKLLVDTKEVVSPERLAIPVAVKALTTRLLLITDIGQYWAVPVLGEKSGLADTVLVFDVINGLPVTNDALVQQLAERDSNLRGLAWVAGEDKLVAVSALKDAALKVELDNIAAVPVADDWSDYRPSRPNDFVGRDDLLESILDFLGSVARRETETRLLAIKAPSGWGKSSFIVKLRAISASQKYSDKIYLYGVDCRTASSSRYPELALKKCFEGAIADGFIDLSGIKECRISSAGQPFSDNSMQEALAQLRAQGKVIVLFFDQFEEITTKQELADLFVHVKSMCSAIESAGENVVLGFSWKTDGTIPTDHPAYHVWHSFSDRRREFELPLFSRVDTSKLLGLLSSELKQPIEMWLRRLLAEHSQGYPWLLKKLCVHVFRVLQAQSAQQRELFERALDVEALFKKDLSDLDAGQVACLEKIAKESPADNFQIVEQFGVKTVDALVARRLVLRNAGKLIVYWDIFRDFVLYKQVPAIPTRYVPVSTPASAKRVLDVISYTSSSQFSSLQKKLSWQRGTLDNVARDLVMMGVCRYDRKNFRVKLIHPSARQSLAAMFKFFTTHVFLRLLVDEFGGGFKSVPQSSIESVLEPSFDSKTFEATTIHNSIVRWLSWQQAIGVLSADSDRAISHNASATVLVDFNSLRIESRARPGSFVFRGEASPQKVVELLQEMASGKYEPKPGNRNALKVLRSLRLVTSASQPKLLEVPPSLTNVETWLALKLLAHPTFKEAFNFTINKRGATTIELGEIIERTSGGKRSEALRARYGSSLSQWILWITSMVRNSQSES